MPTKNKRNCITTFIQTVVAHLDEISNFHIDSIYDPPG